MHAIGSEVDLVVEMVDAVRTAAQQDGRDWASHTFRTRDGLVLVEWRDRRFVRVTFTGDGPARTVLLSHDWGS